MDYAALRAMILDESHRSDLIARVPSFVDRAEAMIARSVRANEMLTRFDLTDADRVAVDSPVYKLPANFLEDKTVVTGERTLRKVARQSLLSISGTGPIIAYAMRHSPTELNIEFRAGPGTGAVIELEYFSRLAPLVADTDTNRLLENHESLYLHGALFALYSWSQDLELAQGALDTWANAMETVNELAGRFIGGTELVPNLNLGHYRTGGSY